MVCATPAEVATQAGVSDPKHYFGLGAVWSDFDDDGHLDLLVANDGEPNYLHRNLGDCTFKEVGQEAGVALSEDGTEQANMGIAIGDYLRTGRMDIAISHFSDEYLELYRNDGHMSFTDVAHTAAIAKSSVPYVGWGDAFLDTANRGLLDLLLVNGHVYPQVDSAKLGTTFREPKLLYVNQGDGTFHETGVMGGTALQTPQVSRGVAVGDLFNTGSLDVVVENLIGEPMILKAEAAPENNWVSFRLLGKPSNRLALNARVYVTCGKTTQMQEFLSGGSYLSQSDLRLHFGLAAASVIDTVAVLWPDGRRQTFQRIPGNQFYVLEEGGQPLLDPTSKR